MPLIGVISSRPTPQRVLEHVWTRIDVRGPDDHWHSSWSVGSHGYPQIGYVDDDGTRTMRLVHRAVWEAINGPIPEGMTVDHRCHVITCANPRHLRLLTNVANAMDNGQGRKTHCPHGHAYDATNTYVDRRGHRRCRACASARSFLRKVV